MNFVDMILPAAFYLFSGITLGSAFGVVASRHPVHSVLFLLLAFFGAAGLFLLLGAELLAMSLIIVYGGAVAVLFLFVVMMLDCELKDILAHGFPLGHLKSWLILLIGGVGIGELVWVGYQFVISPMAINLVAAPGRLHGTQTNTHALGSILYTDYFYLFQVAGLILLVAMIGAIVITLRSRDGVNRQKVGDQLKRTKENSLEMKKMPIGKGIKL